MNLYKKRFPKKEFEDRVIDILRLSPQEWSNFQNTARHFLGKINFHDNLPEHPSKKVLPSSLHIIDTVDSSNTLAAMMHVEHAAHIDVHRDFHKGGGLYETGTSILSSLWNLIGLGPELRPRSRFFGPGRPEPLPKSQKPRLGLCAPPAPVIRPDLGTPPLSESRFSGPSRTMSGSPGR